jgi:hypothetical protein
MAEIERSVYFYKVEMVDDDEEWRRADVLRALDGLEGDARLLSLGDDNFAWAEVDRIPDGNQSGRLRFFRDRRANLPGYALNFNIDDLPIPAEAGIIEPTHVVLGGGGLIAAEYNHFAPRITSAFARLLREKLGLSLRIGTYVQGDILEQLDRLEYIQLLEVSVVPTDELQETLRNSGPFADAAAQLAEVQGGRRLNLRLSGEKHSQSWTDQARSFAHRLFGAAADGPPSETKVLRVTGFDPVSASVEAVDLLKERLVRRTDFEKSSEKSKALNVGPAYTHVEDAIRDVRQTDLPSAGLIF